jgi:hypothetical protein
MAKVTGPMMGFSGSGTLAKTITFGKWRGIQYARQRVVPANPNTTDQQTTRTTFATARAIWQRLPADGQAPWDAFAKGRPFTGMNAFVGQNTSALRGQADTSLFVGSPGALSGLPPVSLALATGSNAGELEATLVAPSIPTGWSITKQVAIAFLSQDPADPFTSPISEATDAATPFAALFTGLDAGSTYTVASWFEWLRPDGITAYSIGLTDDGAAHA